mmetsp:Transcript_28667/g.71391  ORF Transcript_28667/g.71391 Transcript_28667/m.71391 type:complete len:239 (+) Transcript_28667:1718-2434(+)
MAKSPRADIVGSSTAFSSLLPAQRSASSLMSQSESASFRPCGVAVAVAPVPSTSEECSNNSNWLPLVAAAPSASLVTAAERALLSRLPSRSAEATVAARAETDFSKSASGTLQSSLRCAVDRDFQNSCSCGIPIPPFSSARTRRDETIRLPLVSRSELESPPSCKQRCIRASRSRRLVTFVEPSSIRSLLTMCRFSSSAACSMALSASIISARTFTKSNQPSLFDVSNWLPSSAACET